MLIELFSLARTAEALRAIIGSKSAISLQRGPVDPKFQAEGVATTNHSSCQKTRLNDLSYGMKIWTDYSLVLSQFTRLTDGRTNRQTEFLSLDRVCILQRGNKPNPLSVVFFWRQSSPTCTANISAGANKTTCIFYISANLTATSKRCTLRAGRA